VVPPDSGAGFDSLASSATIMWHSVGFTVKNQGEKLMSHIQNRSPLVRALIVILKAHPFESLTYGTDAEGDFYGQM